MKKSSFNLLIGVVCAFALCLMPSCKKEKAVGKIQGIVTNVTTNEPIQGVNISLSPIGLSALTDSEGHYEFINLEVGQYTVKGEKEGFETFTKNVTIVANQVSSGDMKLQPIVSPDGPDGPDNLDDDIVVGDGLFCYFTFDGDAIVDWDGNYTGINHGAVVSTDTPSGEGQSMQFDGSSYIEVPDNIVLGGSEFSINFWFKTNKNDQWIVGTDTYFYDDPKSAIGFTRNSNIKYASGHNNSLLHWTTNPATSYINNRWHMLTLTYDETVGTIYLDGVLFETKESVDLNWGTSINATYFGVATNKSGLLGFFTGKLDNFRSYNRVLTATEVQTLYDAKQ